MADAERAEFGRIEDLDAPSLARLALSMFVAHGRGRISGRLVFRALELDPRAPLAVRLLSDMLDSPGGELYAAAVCEWARAPEAGFDPTFRAQMDDLLFRSKWSWGFAVHDSGATSLNDEAFARRSDFALNDDAYAAFFAQALERHGTLASAAIAARHLLGMLCDALRPEEPDLPLARSADRAAFDCAPEYLDWLRSDVGDLAAYLEN